VSRDIISKNFSPIFALCVLFKSLMDIIFGKIKYHITRKGGRGRYGKMSQNDTGGGGGSKISQKSVTYYLNGPSMHVLLFK
jgi:hypothetical protein